MVDLVKPDSEEKINLRNDKFRITDIFLLLFLLMLFFISSSLVFIIGFHENPFDGINFGKLDFSNFNIFVFPFLIIEVMIFIFISTLIHGFLNNQTIIFEKSLGKIEIYINGKYRETIDLTFVNSLRYYIDEDDTQSYIVNIEFMKNGSIFRKIRIFSRNSLRSFLKHVNVPIETRRRGTGKVFVPFDWDRDFPQ